MLGADGDAGAEVIGADAGGGAGNVVDAFEHAAEAKQREQKTEGHHENPAEKKTEEELTEEMFRPAIEEAEIDTAGAWGASTATTRNGWGKPATRRLTGPVLRDVQRTQRLEKCGAVMGADPERGIGGIADLCEEDRVAAGLLTVIPGKFLSGELGDFFNDAVVESIPRCAEGNLTKGFAFAGEP